MEDAKADAINRAATVVVMAERGKSGEPDAMNRVPTAIAAIAAGRAINQVPTTSEVHRKFGK